MGFLSEFRDILKELSFYETIDEWERGILLRKGLAQEISVRPTEEENEKIKADSKKVNFRLRKSGEYVCNMQESGEKPIKSFRLWKHPYNERKSKELRPGLYFFWPIMERITSLPVAEEVLDLKNVSLPAQSSTGKNSSVVVSCNIRYYVKDVYHALVDVQDYKRTFQTYALSILNQHGRGMKLEDWSSPEKVMVLQETVTKDLRKKPVTDWGLKVEAVHITEGVQHSVHRLFHEGAIQKSLESIV